MNLDLRTYSTFNIGGIAHKVFEIKQKEDIKHIDSYCEYVQKPLVIIGEGSNSIFADTLDLYVIGLMKMTGIEILSSTGSEVLVKAYGGEIWDDLVLWTVEHDLSGIEALSGIPGTCGAAPIQNIGAYGSDVSKSFIEAEVFDRQTKSFVTLIHNQCDFGYRDSIFKKEKNRYIIISITLKLSTVPAKIPAYKDVQDYFIQKQNSQCRHPRGGGDPGSQNSSICHLCTKTAPFTKEIRNAILEIRNNKIPDYKKIPNCGSFFKNPVISKTRLEKIKEKFQDIPSFEISDDIYKVFAGWLIEHVDYKSAQTHTIIFNETNKLVLLNINNGTFEDLQTVLTNITKLVWNTYEIYLEIEPNIFT